MLLSQEFEFEIQHRQGVQHAIADYLSQLDTGEEAQDTYDDFPDSNVIRNSEAATTSTNLTPADDWLEEMTHVLTTRLPPSRMATNKKKRMVVRNQNFCFL